MSTVSSVQFKGHKWAKIRGKILGEGHKSHKCETCGTAFTEVSKQAVKNYTYGKRHVKGKYTYHYIPFTLEQDKAWEDVLAGSKLASPVLLECFVSLILDFATCLKTCTKIEDVRAAVNYLRAVYLAKNMEDVAKSS